jgi:uncharacterized membrane protein
VTHLTTERRWIIGLSALGAANMTAGALKQFGVIRRLPDLPVKGFDSNAVMSSGPAFVFGIPDTPLAIAGLVANIPLALAGGEARARTQPWIPLSIAAKSVVEVSVAAWFLWQMRYRLHTWCAYCIAGASITAAIAVLSLRESREALPTRRARGIGIGIGIGAATAIAVGTLFAMHTLDERRRGKRRRRK